MPPKPKNITLPAWVDSIEDACLFVTVQEAIVARNTAIKFGVEQASDSIRREFASAEKALDAVADGVAKGSTSCSKAAAAIRKYTNVVDKLSAAT